MLRLHEMSKCFGSGPTRCIVADRISFEFPERERVALIGRNGAGKSSLLKILAGLMDPDDGRVDRDGSVSWPIGFQGSFHPDLTGAENILFVARLYGRDTSATLRFVKRFSELGGYFNQPFRTYSSGMRARLAFALSMAIPFDTYLIDEITSVGDAAFRAKCEQALTNRLQGRGAVIVTHSMPFIRNVCHSALVLEGGRATFFENTEDAISYHLEMLSPLSPAAA